MNWIPADKPPTTNNTVLIVAELSTYDRPLITIGWWRSDIQRWCNRDWMHGIPRNVTHWLPLPPLPETTP